MSIETLTGLLFHGLLFHGLLFHGLAGAEGHGV
jgi:hypothetical protein